MKKILALLLLSVLLVSVVACKKNGTTPPEESSSDVVNNENVDSYYKDNFGNLDLNGKELWIYDLNTSPDAHVNHYHDAQGDEINVALYKRDAMLESVFGIKFEYFNSVAGAKHISNPVNSGTYVADIIYGRASGDRLMTLAQSACLLDMKSLPSLSFDEPWWSNFMSEALTINDRMYFTSGDVLPTFYQSPGCFFFNTNLGEVYGITKESLSAAVTDGSWTWEKMNVLSANATSNLDTDITLTAEADQFGFLPYEVYNHTNMFAIGAGVKLCEQTGDGTWSLDLTDPTKSDKLSRLADQLTFYDVGDKAEIIGGTFKSGRAVFAAHFVESAFNTLTDMQNDYLMLPIPKIDTDQENYYCMVNSYVNCFAGILSNCADPETTAAILECMAYSGYKDIRPIVYERVLKTRLASDSIATGLVDKIFDSAYIDYAVIEKFGVTSEYKQGVSTVLFNYLKDKQPLNSGFESIGAQAQGELDEMLETFTK